MYEPLMLALAADFRLLAPDTPGAGMSDATVGATSIAGLAAGIAEFLDELGIERCYLFGHHTGASIAAEIAAAHPRHVAAVALSGPTLLNDDLKRRLPAMATAIPVSDDGGYLQVMWERIRGKDETAPLHIVERETVNGLKLGNRYAAIYEAVVEQNFSKVIAAITCPVLVFAGTGDPLFHQLDTAMQLLVDGRKATVADAKTFICETHCAEVVSLLHDFFPREAA